MVTRMVRISLIPLLLSLPFSLPLSCGQESFPGAILLTIEPSSTTPTPGEQIENLLIVVDPLYPFLDDAGEQYSDGDTYDSSSIFTDYFTEDPEVELLITISLIPYKDRGEFPVIEFVPQEGSRSPYRFQVFGEDAEGEIIAKSSVTPFIYIIEDRYITYTIDDFSLLEGEE